jgi:hypothetical protein
MNNIMYYLTNNTGSHRLSCRKDIFIIHAIFAKDWSFSNCCKMTHHLYIFNERQLNDFDGDKTRQEMTNTLLKSHLSYYKAIIYIHIIYKTTKSHS